MKMLFWKVAVLALTVGPVSGAVVDEKTVRLEQKIEHASELGAYSEVQELRVELARYSANLGHYVEAARQYELLLASRPSRRERVKFFIELGKMREASENYATAINAFQDALHDDPTSWDANLALARAYTKSELNSRAVEAYLKCIQLRPKSSDGFHEIAGVYQRMGYLNKAIANYQRALRLRPAAESYLGLADCFVRQGDIPRATLLLQTAKTSVPLAAYDVRLGEIFEKQGKTAQSAAAWEEALKLEPQRDDVKLQLAMAYGRLHRRAEADRLFHDLMGSYPDSPLVHFLRAWLLFNRGERQSARAEVLVVQNLGPTELVRHYNERLLTELGK